MHFPFTIDLCMMLKLTDNNGTRFQKVECFPCCAGKMRRFPRPVVLGDKLFREDHVHYPAGYVSNVIASNKGQSSNLKYVEKVYIGHHELNLA